MIIRFFQLTALLISLPLMAQWEDAETHFLTSDTLVEFATDHSLMTDPNNNLHVLYMREREDSIGYDVFYDRRDPDGIWNGATQINNNNTPVWDASLAAVRTDSFHIAWIGNGEDSRELFVTTFRGITKIERQVTSNTTEEYQPATFVDRQGYLHLAWAGFDTDSIARIFYANNAFQDTLIVQKLAFSDPGVFVEDCRPSLAIAHNGSAHVINRSDINGDTLQYMFNTDLNSPFWSTNFIPSPDSINLYGYLSVGADGKLHTAFAGKADEDEPQQIHYANKVPNNNGNWNDIQLVDEDQLGELSSIDIDSEGNVHIGINEVQNGEAQGNLLYANNLDEAWNVIELIEDESTFDCRIMLDNIDQAYAICARTNDTLPGQELIVYGNPVTMMTEIPEDTIESGISNNVLVEWSVAPNPSSDYFEITFPLGSRLNQWTLLDASGQSVITGDCMDCFSTTLTASDLPGGIYLLQIISDGYQLSEKLMLGF